MNRSLFKPRKSFLRIAGIALAAAFAASAQPQTQAEKITSALKAGDWVRAEALLAPYMAEHPDQKWTYSSRSWALWNLQEYRKAADTAIAGLKRWPGDLDLARAAAAALGDLAQAQPDAGAVVTLKQALSYQRKDYLVYRLAVRLRSAGQLQESLATIEAGAVEFPEYAYFKETLPYARYLLFKELTDATEIQRFVDRTVDWLDPATPLHKQEHYMMIIHAGLRKNPDRQRFEAVYRQLFAKLPDNPSLYDAYGFALYASFRVHGRTNDALLKEAVTARRKARDLFWKKNSLPPPVRDLSPPLRGRHAVWSGFDGSAMTHNGFANYCYDFAAVDSGGSIVSREPAVRLGDYYMFDKPVYAVADGEVTGIVSGYPDNPPGAYADQANTVTISHKSFFSFYAHLKNGGVSVSNGQKVRSGDLIGYTGNSGMSSQPHMHFCVYGLYDEWVTIPFQFKKMRVEREALTEITDRPYREGDTVTFE